jgi:hypothetical protein
MISVLRLAISLIRWNRGLGTNLGDVAGLLGRCLGWLLPWLSLWKPRSRITRCCLSLRPTGDFVRDTLLFYHDESMYV